MPTRHDRIPVTKDPELAAALERVAPLVPAGTKPATLVRDLAVRGADALIAEHRADAEQLERLIARNVAADPGSTARCSATSTARPGASSRERRRLGGVLIADTSVDGTHATLREPWAAARRARTIATCSLVTVKLLYSTRSADDFQAVEADLATLRDIPVTVSVQRAATGALRALADTGPRRHRVPLATR